MSHAEVCHSRFLLPSAVALTLTTSLVWATPATTQEDLSITWTESTSVEVPGTFGMFLQAVPGGLENRESEHGLHVMGSRLREDSGSQSSIVDAEGGRLVNVDHQGRTYTEIGPEEMGEISTAMAEIAQDVQGDMEAMMDEMRADMTAEQQEAMAEMRARMREAEEAMDFTVESRNTGDRDDIEGFSAERHIVLGELTLDEGVQGVEAGDGGALVFLVELWQTDEFPEAEAVYEAWGSELASDPEFQAVAADLAEAVQPAADAFGPELLTMWDPRMASGMDRIAELEGSLDGRTLRRTVTVAVVPEDVELDEEALLAWEPESMGTQLQGAAGDATRDAAADAARDAIGGLTGGLFGGGGDDDDEEEEEEEPVVQPLLRMTTEVRDVETASPSAELFEPSPDYTRRDLMEELRQAREQLQGLNR